MVEIDNQTYSEEYVKKAIRLYQYFENGKLERELAQRFKESLK